MTALAAPIGAGIGVLMGAVGGGGSLIAIPLLVYVAGQSPRAAQATALVIVIAASLAGLSSHLRQGDVRFAFGLAAGVSAYAGSALNNELDPDALLLAFAPVMLLGAGAMVSERIRQPADFTPWRFGVEVGEVARVLVLGGAVGLLTGLFGVGGGFLIVPAMVLVLRLSMIEAVGTSLLVISLASCFALADRLETGDLVWAVAVPFAVAGMIGAVAGRRLAERVDPRRLRLGFAGTVTVAAIYTGARSASALFAG